MEWQLISPLKRGDGLEKKTKQNELQKHYLLLLLFFATHSGARFLFCCPAGLPVEGGGST